MPHELELSYCETDNIGCPNEHSGETGQNPRQALAGGVLECVCVFKILQGTYC